MLVVLLVAILFALILLFTVLKQDEEIRTLRREVEKHKNIAEQTQYIHEGFRNRAIIEEQKYEIIYAEYRTSDADLTKYSNKEKKRNAMRSKLSMLIGNGIAKRYEPTVLPLGDGKEKYSLTVKVKQI